MAVFHGIVLDNDSRSLDVGGLKVSEQAMLIAGSGWDTVVADQWLGEDENLAAVRGIGHGLGVAHKRGCKHCFARDVGFGAKRFSGEDGAILNSSE
jgi:hypothetical protein